MRILVSQIHTSEMKVLILFLKFHQTAIDSVKWHDSHAYIFLFGSQKVLPFRSSSTAQTSAFFSLSGKANAQNGVSLLYGAIEKNDNANLGILKSEKGFRCKALSDNVQILQPNILSILDRLDPAINSCFLARRFMSLRKNYCDCFFDVETSIAFHSLGL